ncbi:uncharacterized protein B0I36DRAFT_366134 [Microdochium trichocladiopsis]|uniref:CorA-like transporter domain-containing protein n=1 Tax=Microdochium trichocladiopsis TaxID=1682393 RepID=A0A9P9BMS9_9PEZI|nr:uncharacterized protein B0I36DRAFT_366134 [Microdochium trichocladiopsis]KAH7026590.1 hypothetical protein B0I36DRAFT_366134 [Microdochium trichocladiopsis]
MTSKCFVQQVLEPIKIIDIVHDDASRPGLLRSRELHNLEDLSHYFEQPEHSAYKCRIIFICQRNSWRPLQITQLMLQRIALEHRLGPAFLDLPSCFYNRNQATEEAYSLPISHNTDGSRTELTYTVRYPEFKQTDSKWAIRQSGVCHSYDRQTSQHLFVLFSPTPHSALQEQAERYLASKSEASQASAFWMHQLLFSTYYPNWRKYIASEEQVFLPISGTTFSTYIDQPLRFGYDQLSVLISLHNRFLQMPAMLAHGAEILDELDCVLGTTSSHTHNSQISAGFKNLRRHCHANSRNALYLQHRIQSTAKLLSDTLSFRDQVVAKEQNGTMLQLNKSAVFITMLTLLYLPASFVASFFGMNFFDYDNDSGSLIGSSMIWIFVLATFGLTGVTFLSYYWLLKHDGRIFSKLAPTVHLRDWKHLKRRFSLRGEPHGENREKLPI